MRIAVNFAFLSLLAPCAHWQLSASGLKPTPFGCAVVQAGGIFSSGPGLDGGAVAYAAAGRRLGFEIDLTSRLSARLATDFLGLLARRGLRIEGQPVWQARPFSMAVGGRLGASF